MSLKNEENLCKRGHVDPARVPSVFLAPPRVAAVISSQPRGVPLPWLSHAASSFPVFYYETTMRFRSSSTATGHNGNSPSTVAIDSKIEQAMDLVKSHLMFAVREEVEGLRQKIGELETHVS